MVSNIIKYIYEHAGKRNNHWEPHHVQGIETRIIWGSAGNRSPCSYSKHMFYGMCYRRRRGQSFLTYGLETPTVLRHCFYNPVRIRAFIVPLEFFGFVLVE